METTCTDRWKGHNYEVAHTHGSPNFVVAVGRHSSAHYLDRDELTDLRNVLTAVLDNTPTPPLKSRFVTGNFFAGMGLGWVIGVLVGSLL